MIGSSVETLCSSPATNATRPPSATASWTCRITGTQGCWMWRREGFYRGSPPRRSRVLVN